jgi:hypothetical protein
MGGDWTPPPSTEATVITLALIGVLVLTPFIALAALIVALVR